MDLSLRNKTALVCGSTQGIGLAIAQELALLGATCILMARNRQSLESVLPTLNKDAGQLHRIQQADFSVLEEVENGVSEQLQLGPMHILINNTGGPAAGPITEAATGSFSSGFQQHVLSSQLLAQALLPGMKKEGYGRIINVVSTSVKVPLPNLGVSNTIRAAMAGWAKSWANEVAQWGITVNNVLPGFTDTARLGSLIAHTAAATGKDEETVRKEMQVSVPAKRFGTSAEVAALAAFLATPAAAYINGTNIPVDGGRTGAF